VAAGNGGRFTMKIAVYKILLKRLALINLIFTLNNMSCNEAAKKEKRNEYEQNMDKERTMGSNVSIRRRVHARTCRKRPEVFWLWTKIEINFTF
jgi:predicted transcriptional regulator